MSKKEILLLVLVQLFFIVTIFPGNDIFSGVITGGMMLCCLLFNSVKEKIELVKKRPYIIWMVLFFLWVFLSVFLSKDIRTGFGALDPRLPLLYFPVTIGLVKLRKEFKERLLLGFALVITAFCVLSMGLSINRYLQTGNIDAIYSDGLTYYADHSAIYVAVFVNFSIYIFSLFIFFRPYRFRLWLIPALVFLLVMSFLLAGRNMLIVLSILSFGFVLYYIFIQKKYIPGLSIVAGMLILILLSVKLFPKTLNRFTDLNFTKYEFNRDATESNYSNPTTADQWNGANFRLAAWRCGWELFKEYPITGVHIGDKKAKLNEKYKEKNFQFALQTNRNVHNNYLDILLGTGIIGFLLYLGGWLILPLRRSWIAKDYLSAIMIITFAIAMITEVYFDRSFGGMYFGFFIPFLLCDDRYI